ncbi:MAG: caspase family protein [Alphaproteobacteria bacterium]|nr:caspase family protein [Alphaproteobacteria bacterium]
MAHIVAVLIFVAVAIFPASRIQAATASAADINFGRFHALVIGINAYDNLPKLETAVNDASAMHDVLRRDYGYESTLLLNPTRSDLLRAFDKLRADLTEDDNLLIFYAGHGILDRQTNEGFWLPKDADEDSQVEWIPVSTVTRFLKATAAKQALVVADSCYSGTLTREAPALLPTGSDREAELLRISSKRARKALTSGGLEPVNDGGGDGHSVFTRALLETLRGNRTVLDGYQLYTKLRRRVALNAEQTPQYSDIRFASDEGGDFLFVPTSRRGRVAPTAAPATASPQAPIVLPGTDKEMVFWQSIQNSQSAADYEAYLGTYPNGEFALLARARLKALTKTQTAALVPAPKPESKVEVVPRDEELVALRNINVRAEPTARSKKLATLKRGTKVAVTGKVEGVEWYQVAAAEDEIGYVYAPLLGDSAPPRPSAGASSGTEMLLWSSIKDSKDARDYRAYLAAYPKGAFAALAKARLEQLEGSKVVARVPPKPSSTIKSKTSKAPLHDCDKLAANPDDTQRLGSGINYDKIDVRRALQACKRAVAGYPGTARFLYQYGRALHRDRQYGLAVDWFRKAADAGHAAAMNALALAYRWGNGVEKSEARAFRWYQRAAEAAFPPSYYQLAVMYDQGRGVDVDYGAAVRWFTKGAKRGNASSQSYLGWMYEMGRGVSKDLAAAVHWYRKAGEQGFAAAQSNLGWMYESGRGVAKSYRDAARWYRKAAEQGQARGQNNLATLYRNGDGVRQDDGEAVRLYRKAAEQNHAAAQTNLGWMYEMGRGTGKDPAEAVRWYRKAAEQDYVSAQTNLGWMYEMGRGVAKDESEAVRWYRKAAEQGQARGQTNLGWMYEMGRGVGKDAAEAVRWYRKAAEQGQPRGQNNLASMYKRGTGIRQDYNEAVRWYRKSADQNYAVAQNNLGVMYQRGLGVAVDYAEAVRWYRKSANQNYKIAQFNLGHMYWSGSGIGQDQQEARRWWRKAADQGYQKAIDELRKRGG